MVCETVLNNPLQTRVNMNYNAVAFCVMMLGIIIFYIFFTIFPLFESVLALVFFEVVATVLFLFAEIDQRCKALEKRIKKLEEKNA